MKSCPACGENIKSDALKCKFCEADLNLRKCPWCAELIDKDAKRCRYCKTFLAKIRCDGCSELAEIAEMRCGDCIEKMVAAEVEKRLGELKKSMDLKNWLILAILVALAAFALNQIF
ncbi:zinc ribbon domain-containing protein [Candidatus Gracilibacteria bacterium]|nr:zinc ribbon domain-containing protein [Candidatus Gracilibacteria bacterium]MCF7856650.1 zinc ribbon domain-containing protein [Candidatus Gracilibacteria bacterium]MCF7896967.1 zinc ribbon domain-containing protein [Candidatus Gracilibacteria bacterium]